MATKRKRNVGFTKKRADYILKELEKGRTLTRICKDDDLPTYSTVQKWVRDDVEDFAQAYKVARESQLNLWVDQMMDIADLPPPVPPETVKDDKGKEIALKDGDRKLWVNAENQRRRLKVDTIKFQAGKLAGVMGHNTKAGVQVTGDVINILNYATMDPALIVAVDPSVAEVKEVPFIDTTETP
jgi:hypothetical protein